MTTSTVTRKVRSRRSPIAANPKRFCGSCFVERCVEDQNRDELNGLCTDCFEKGAVALITIPAPAESPEETAEETAARLTTLGLDPETVDVRRCGNCDTNIADKPAEVRFCSEGCKAEDATAEAAKAAKAKQFGEVRMAVQWSIRDNLTDYEIRTGLNNAWKLREGNRFTPDAVAAAARVWFEDYNRDTYARGARNTKVLRVLNAVRRLVEG